MATGALALALVAVGMTAAPLGASAEGLGEPTTFTIPITATDVAYTPDGTKAYATESATATVAVIDVASRTVVRRIDVDRAPKGVAISADGRTAVVSATYDDNLAWPGVVTVIDVATDTVVNNVRTAGRTGYDIAISPDGDTAWVSGSLLQVAEHVRTAHIASTVQRAGRDVFEIAQVEYSPDGSSVYVVGQYEGGTRFDAASKQVNGGMGNSWNSPSGLAVSPDGSRVYIGSYGEYITGVDTAGYGGGMIKTDADDAADFAFSRSGSTLYTTQTRTSSLGLLDYATGKMRGSIPVGFAGWDLALSPSGREAIVVGSDVIGFVDLPAPDLGAVAVDRLQGPSRYASAVAISQAGYPDSAPVVWVATGENFPDALSAAPAAVAQHGPLLLTSKAFLPAEVEAEIRRLHPSKIVVVGGENSVSQATRASLRSIAQLDEIGGADRYAVSRAILRYAFPDYSSVYIAGGANFPDALSAAAPAAAAGAPVLLMQGDLPSQSLPADLGSELNAILTSRHLANIRIVGGPSSVSDGTLSAISFAADGYYFDEASQWYYDRSLVRLWGGDRYSTSANVNGQAFLTSERMYLAVGTTFPDALAGAALAGAKGAPLYVTPTNCIPERIADDIASRGVSTVTLLGGMNSLGAGVESLTVC